MWVGLGYRSRDILATKDLSYKGLGAGGLMVQAAGIVDRRDLGRNRDWEPGWSVWTPVVMRQIAGEEEGELGLTERREARYTQSRLTERTQQSAP